MSAISVICVFLAFLLAYAAKIPVAFAMHNAFGRYDNRHPRAQQAKLEGWGARATAAHLNSLEGFAPFSAAVLAAQMMGADPHVANALAATYVASRACYIAAYIGNRPTVRSALWFLGFFYICGLFGVALARV